MCSYLDCPYGKAKDSENRKPYIKVKPPSNLRHPGVHLNFQSRQELTTSYRIFLTITNNSGFSLRRLVFSLYYLNRIISDLPTIDRWFTSGCCVNDWNYPIVIGSVQLDLIFHFPFCSCKSFPSICRLTGFYINLGKPEIKC